MNILTKLWLIWLTIIQALGFSPKTYDKFFHRLPRGNYLKIKGHLLRNPTAKQIRTIYLQIIRKIRIEEWRIEDNIDLYSPDSDNSWIQRPTSIIDKIVVDATDASTWSAGDLYEFDTSEKNTVTPGKPLPGISCHMFVSTSAMVEKVSDYENMIWHTPSMNLRSLNVMLQYTIKNNSSAPQKKMMLSLERLLTAICLQLKLDPYKAIVGQREVIFRWLPFIKARRQQINISPGILVDLDALRRQIAIKIQKKLRYAETYHGPINGKINRSTIKAMNYFHSEAISQIFNRLKNKDLEK